MIIGGKRRSRPGVALLGVLALSGCATAPINVWKMPPEQLQALSEEHLCYAYALARADRRATPEVNAEVARRRITCGAAVEQVVSDCSDLRVMQINGNPAQGATIFTVANQASKPKNFRIYYRNIQSSRFLIAANTTGDFGVRVEPLLGAAAGVVAARNRDLDVELNDCVAPQEY